MLYDSIEVRAIKLAIARVDSLEERKSVLLKCISYLEEYYNLLKEKHFLYEAIWHIYAFLELGYAYSDVEESFQRIAKVLHIEISEIMEEERWKYAEVPLKKSNLRNLLGRWNPRLHTMKIDEVVDDIINRVTERQEGEYRYGCGKNIDNNMLWEHTFRLEIRGKDAIFHDVNKDKYYRLI